MNKDYKADSKKTRRTVNYDFCVDSLVSVEALEGTDPETLIEQAKIKVIQNIRTNDLILVFDTCFDKQTGDYYQDWEDK